MKKLILAMCIIMTNLFAAQAAGPKRIDLWEKKAPHVTNPNDTAWIEVYTAPEKKATGRAVIICPGGGYQHLAMDHEGRQWAPWFNNLGISVFVLHYRMPNGDCRIPMDDVRKAFEVVRENAKEWHIDPQDIGIMGSSAGGHLAATAATHMKQSDGPAFQILFYPVITMDPDFTHRGSHDNLLGKKPGKKQEALYSCDQQVSDRTPRAWIGVSDDDRVVPAANSMSYAQELYRHDVSVSMHIYPTGGHGWGIRPAFAFHAEMLQELRAWLEQ